MSAKVNRDVGIEILARASKTDCRHTGAVVRKSTTCTEEAGSKTETAGAASSTDREPAKAGDEAVGIACSTTR